LNNLPTTITTLILGQKYNITIEFNKLLNLKYLELGREYNQFFNVSNLHKLKYLEFGYNYNYDITNDTLSNSIEILKLPTTYNKTIHKLNLSLKKIYFGKYYNKQIDLHYLTNLISIEFGIFFNQNIYTYNIFDKMINFVISTNNTEYIHKYLPNNLKELKFGSKFNKSVNYLPDNLKIIYFGFNFNNPVDNLPKSLEKIILGKKFNQSLDLLPDSITHIIFSFSFNPIISLYDNTYEAFTNGDFNFPIKKLPKNIKHLTFYENYKYI